MTKKQTVVKYKHLNFLYMAQENYTFDEKWNVLSSTPSGHQANKKAWFFASKTNEILENQRDIKWEDDVIETIVSAKFSLNLELANKSSDLYFDYLEMLFEKYWESVSDPAYQKLMEKAKIIH